MGRLSVYKCVSLAMALSSAATVVACGGHSAPQSGTAPETAPNADSARSANVERSKSSASQSVDFEREERSRFTRVEQMIQAHFSGVQVVSTGGGYSIRIRGTGSLGSGNEPLVMIDGASRTPADLRSINPLDVKRIEIVKDGAASFYGSRGANGVIVITTGRGP